MHRVQKLKWQRLIPFEKHWEGIISHCHADNKVKLGFVEGVNNKICVIQRKAQGYRDEEYLKRRFLPTRKCIDPIFFTSLLDFGQNIP
jgi:transposase